MIFLFVLLDLSCVFDTIEHNILQNRLENYVETSGMQHEEAQGSVLAPLLFSLYIQYRKISLTLSLPLMDFSSFLCFYWYMAYESLLCIF